MYYGELDAFSSGLAFYTTTLDEKLDFSESQAVPDVFTISERQYTLRLDFVGYDHRIDLGDEALLRIGGAIQDTSRLTQRTMDNTYADEDGAIQFTSQESRILLTRADLRAGVGYQSRRTRVEVYGLYTPVIYADTAGAESCTDANVGPCGAFTFSSLTFSGLGGGAVLDLGGLLFGQDLYASVDYESFETEFFSFDGDQRVPEGFQTLSRVRAKAGLGLPSLALGALFPMVSVNVELLRVKDSVEGSQDNRIIGFSLDLRNL